MNLNNIYEMTTISILKIIYVIGVLTYLIFGYLFLINDYKVANECKGSSLWIYVLVIIIITTFGFLKIVIKKESAFDELARLLENESKTMLTGCILTIFYSGFVSWGVVVLLHKPKYSCNDLEKTSLWKFAICTLSFHVLWFLISCFMVFNFKKVNYFFNGDENLDNNNDQLSNLNSQIDDLLTRINTQTQIPQQVEANHITEIDATNIEVTPTANVEIIRTDNNVV